MKDKTEQKTKRYSLGEEIFNSVTHGVGSLLSIAGTAVLTVMAALYSDAWGIVPSPHYPTHPLPLLCPGVPLY